MTKAEALYSFWSSFGLPTLDEQSSYDEGIFDDLGISYPYLTYQSAVGSLDGPVTLSADLYYRDTTWTDIEAKAAEIAAYIGGGCMVPYDGGAIWITKTTPDYQRMAADNVFDIRRIHFEINAEFLSA